MSDVEKLIERLESTVPYNPISNIGQLLEKATAAISSLLSRAEKAEASAGWWEKRCYEVQEERTEWRARAEKAEAEIARLNAYIPGTRT